MLKIIKSYLGRNFVPALSGILCISLGITCIMGWHTHTLELVQIKTGLTAMVYNTCLSFLIFGIGLLSLLTSYKRFALIPGLLLIIVASLTIIEYLFNIQLGIDELFHKDYVSIQTTTPGRMSPNTAISDLICGFSLLVLSFNYYKKSHYYFLLFLQILLFSISAFSLLGYAMNMSSTYQWYNFTPMALHTAIGFLIASLGLLVIIFKNKREHNIDLSKGMPALAFILVMSFTVLLLRASYQDAIVNVQHLTNLEKEQVHNTVQTKIEESILDLVGFKTRAHPRTFTSEKEWIKSAEFYKGNLPWYDAIVWVNPSFNVLYSISFNNNINVNSENNLIKQELYEKAVMDQGVSFSPIINFTPQSRGMLVCLPFYNGSSLEGFIVGLINTDYLFNSIMVGSLNDGFIVKFYENKESIKERNKIASVDDIQSKGYIQVYDLDLLFTVKPTPEFLYNNTHSLHSYLIFVIGLFMGTSLAVVVNSRLKSKQQQVLLEQTQSMLRKEFDESMHLNNILSLLKDLADGLLKTTSLEKASEVISSYCSLLLPSSSGSLYLIDESENALILFSKWGEKNLKKISFSVQKCQSIQPVFKTYSIDEACEILCDKTDNHDPHKNSENAMFIPLFSHNKILGILQIEPNDEYQSIPMSLVETITKQISPALSNIKLGELLKIQATRDPLTNLFNRRYLDESLPRELYHAKRSSQMLSLMMLDIDFFKKINDAFGHKEGDKVLKKIGTYLQEKSRKGDIACRFGGEEFLLVLPEASSEDAQKRAEQIREGIAKMQFSWLGDIIEAVTVSIGISTYPGDGEIVEDLILVADKALYRAKAKGRNRVEFGKYDTIVKDEKENKTKA